MKIPVLGLDPSLRNWGLAEGLLDMETGTLENVHLTLIQTEKDATKNVRVNSKDLQAAEDLATGLLPIATKAKVIFAEVPVGSQSAAAMKGYGICIGILGVLRAQGIPIIEVTAKEVKKVFTGDSLATKKQMIAQAVDYYPDANFPRDRGKATGRILDKAEHVADALAAIHAGVQTPVFQNLMRLFAKV